MLLTFERKLSRQEIKQRIKMGDNDPDALGISS